jgi:ATP-dependent Zn protease
MGTPMAGAVSRRIKAYHEAGHVVACLVSGRPFLQATLWLDLQKGELRASMTNDPRTLWGELLSHEASVRQLERELVTCFAGPAAAEIFTGGWDCIGASEDTATARFLAEQQLDEEDVAACLEQAKEQARKLVADHWQLVCAIGEALEECGSLTYEDCVGIARNEGFSPPPAEMLP